MTETNKDPNLLEDALRDALHRKDAPEGFTASVLARIAQQYSTTREVKRTSWLSIVSAPLVRWAAFATVSICLVIGGVHYRNVQREREGEAAKQQLMILRSSLGLKMREVVADKVVPIWTKASQSTNEDSLPH